MKKYEKPVIEELKINETENMPVFEIGPIINSGKKDKF